MSAAFSRRTVLAAAGAGLLVLLTPRAVVAAPADVARLLEQQFGNRPIRPGRVALDIPALAENGNSVALSVDVESPMTDADHVIAVTVFAEANPVPTVARFEFSALSGRAHVRTRIRLADTQTLLAVAEMRDGSLWSGSAETIVTQAACLDFLI